MKSISFAEANTGLQIGESNAPITAHIHIPASDTEHPGKIFQKRVDACRRLLFLTDPVFDRETLKGTKGQRTPGTCEWICENSIYQSWRDDEDSRCIWLSGGPGKGKTMLSIFLTEEIETRMEAVEDTKLLFYMCSHQDEKRNNAAAIMRSLIYQILTKSPRLFEHVSSYFEDSTRVQAALSSPHILWTILKLMLQANTDTIFCVLDGLDECDDESVRLIVEMFRQYFLSCPIKSTGKFKLIIVSRRVAGLDVFPHVRLDPDNNDNVSGDIQSFISERISRLQEIRGFDEIQEYVENSLLKRAQGTFLWVGFVTDELRKKTTCTEIVETLKDLPAGLPAIYSRVLMQTEECHRPMIAKILRWVTTAVRPLNLRELAAGIGLESTDVLKKGQIMLDYIRLCENLLEVHDKKITLVHQSVRDYLLQGTLASDPILGQFHIKEDAAHFEIAETCVQQLECGFSSQWNGEYDESIGWKYQQFELLEYAILHWTEHVKQASSSSNPNLASLFNRPFFQDQPGAYKNWWLKLENDRGRVRPLYMDYGYSQLHLASYLGLESWIRHLLPKRFWGFKPPVIVNKRNNQGESPLSIASSQGHEATVKLLIERGAKTKGDESSALVRAASGGHVGVVRILLDNGVSVNQEDADGHTGLIEAARSGQEDVMKLLLEKGADPNKSSNYDVPALTWAILRNAPAEKKTAAVTLLLGKGADINQADGFGNTALIEAVRNRDAEMVKLLLEKGADYKRENQHGMSAMREARKDIRTEHGGIVRLLRKAAEEDLEPCRFFWPKDEGYIPSCSCEEC